MNWDALGAVGEIIGAVAVILTVGYLALQIRQNTAAVRSTATQGASQELAGVYHTLCTDPELAMIFVRGLKAPNELSDPEMARYFSLHMMTMFNMQTLYMQTQNQFMDETLLLSWSRVVSDIFETPGFQLFWGQRKHVFAPEFREYLEAEVFTKKGDPNYRPLGVA